MLSINFPTEDKSVFAINDPKTIEEYKSSSCIKRASWQMKWIQEEMVHGNNIYKDKLYYFESKDMKKTTYQVKNINTKTLSKEYDTIDIMLKDNNISVLEYRYIMRYSNKEIKNPKYKSFGNITFVENKYILKGNDYIKLETY